MSRSCRAAPWVAVAVVGALAGCAAVPVGPSVLVLPGAQKSPEQFQADNGDCQVQAKAQVEPQVQAANNQAAATAVVGTAIGAAVGALFGYGGYTSQSAAWGAGTGLAFGSAIGSSGSQAANYGVQQRYDMAFVQCMVLRGNQLPAQAGAKRYWQTPPPPPLSPKLPPSIPPPDTPPPIGAPPPA